LRAWAAKAGRQFQMDVGPYARPAVNDLGRVRTNVASQRERISSCPAAASGLLSPFPCPNRAPFQSREPLPLCACLYSLLPGSERNRLLVLGLRSASQAEGRRFEPGLAVQMYCAPSVTYAVGVFAFQGCVIRGGRIGPSGDADRRERQAFFEVRYKVGVPPEVELRNRPPRPWRKRTIASATPPVCPRCVPNLPAIERTAATMAEPPGSAPACAGSARGPIA